jgi:hypothetical protein
METLKQAEEILEQTVTNETEEEVVLADGPVESVEPYVNPPMDHGYHPDPVDPIPYIDPFAELAAVASKKIPPLFEQLRSLPWQVVQSSHKKLMAMPDARQLSGAQKQLLMACVNPKLNPQECLERCSIEELGALADAMQDLAKRKMPLTKTLQLEQEQQALQVLYYILEAEGLRRNA